MTIASKHIKEAIRLHLEEEGTLDHEAIRSVITEVLHIARKRFNTCTLDDLHKIISEGAFKNFLEEQEELRKIDRIPDKDLPLHSVDGFKFEISKDRFIERLKG
jgi:hypothetical protein